MATSSDSSVQSFESAAEVQSGLDSETKVVLDKAAAMLNEDTSQQGVQTVLLAQGLEIVLCKLFEDLWLKGWWATRKLSS